MTEDDAKQLVMPLLEGSQITAVDDFGDVFMVYFVNNAYFKSGDMRDMAIGAGPTLVDKTTREVFPNGSGRPPESIVEAYRACGDPYGYLTNVVEIVALPDDVEHVACAKAFRKILNCSPQSALEIVKDIASKTPRRLSLDSESDTTYALQELLDYGFVGRQLWSTEV